MRIKVNDVKYEFVEEKLSITQILGKLNFTFPIIIVKHNDAVIQNTDFDSYFIKDNDELIVMHIFAGGWDYYNKIILK